MGLARGEFIEAIVRLQLLEDQFDLPASRVGLSNALGIERIGVDVGEVEPILGALGEANRDQAHTTANGTSGTGVDATLEGVRSGRGRNPTLRVCPMPSDDVTDGVLADPEVAGDPAVAPPAVDGIEHLRSEAV